MVALVTNDRPNPDAGIRIVSRSSWVAVSLIVIGMLVAPNNPLMSLLLVSAVLVARHFAVKHLTRQGKLEDFVTKTTEREFTEIPQPTDDKGKLALVAAKPYWEPEGVCFEKIHDVESIRKGDLQDQEAWYRCRVINPAKYQAQEQWLATTYPDRHRAVRTWWLRAYLLPGLERRFPDYEFKATEIWDPIIAGTPSKARRAGLDEQLPDRWECHARKRGPTDLAWEPADLTWCQEVAIDYQYQLYVGVRLAINPKRWKRRIDRRPSHRAIGFLHNALLDLYGGNRPSSQELPEDLRILKPNFNRLYFGHGFEWDVRHLQKLHEVFGEDLATVTGGAQTDGDPRIYATGQDEIRPIFLDERTLNYHAQILGQPGSGKTRFLENVLVQAIQSGRPVIMVDPKLDRGLFNRVWEVARQCGRGHQLHLFHLNAPRCREVSEYNPLYVYDDPAELAARVAAVVEKTRDPFWFRVGISTAKAVTMLSHYTMTFLRIAGAEFIDGKWQLAARFGNTPPKYLLALQYRWDNPKASAKIARTAIEDFLKHRTDPAWVPTTPSETNLLEMCRQPFFSPFAWNPSLKPVNVFGIGRPETLVAWSLRVIYFHLFITDASKEAKRSNLPELLGIEEVVGNSEDSWWQMYMRHKEHPLKALLDPSYRGQKYNETAIEYLREFIPQEAVEQLGRADCEKWDQYVHDSLRMMHAKAVEDRKEYQKHMSTLAAALSNFEGERERLLTSQDPDIILRDCVMNGGIVYYATNYMKDSQASEGAARTFVIDGLAFLGDVYGASAKGRYDFYFACDEVATFITTDLTPFMSQGRSAGVHTILLGQNGVDVQVALGDKAKADQVTGNTVTRINLCTGNMQDARDFSESLGKRTIHVRGGFSLNTTKAYGNTGVATIGDYSQSQNESWSDKEVERVPPSCLLSLPTGQAFVRSKFGLHMVIQGQLPAPKCNVMEEFGLLRYLDHDQEPPIALRHQTELDITNARIEREGIFHGKEVTRPIRTQIPAQNLPKDRGADMPIIRSGSSVGSDPKTEQPSAAAREGNHTTQPDDGGERQADHPDDQDPSNPASPNFPGDGGDDDANPFVIV